MKCWSCKWLRLMCMHIWIQRIFYYIVNIAREKPTGLKKPLAFVFLSTKVPSVISWGSFHSKSFSLGGVLNLVELRPMPITLVIWPTSKSLPSLKINWHSTWKLMVASDDIFFLFKLVPFQRTWLFFGGYDSIEESRKKQSQPGLLVATTHDNHNLHEIWAPNAAHLPFRERKSSKKSRVCSGN